MFSCIPLNIKGNISYSLPSLTIKETISPSYVSVSILFGLQQISQSKISELCPLNLQSIPRSTINVSKQKWHVIVCSFELLSFKYIISFIFSFLLALVCFIGVWSYPKIKNYIFKILLKHIYDKSNFK